jgi:hypothetical protein
MAERLSLALDNLDSALKAAGPSIAAFKKALALRKPFYKVEDINDEDDGLTREEREKERERKRIEAEAVLEMLNKDDLFSKLLKEAKTIEEPRGWAAEFDEMVERAYKAEWEMEIQKEAKEEAEKQARTEKAAKDVALAKVERLTKLLAGRT